MMNGICRGMRGVGMELMRRHGSGRIRLRGARSGSPARRGRREAEAHSLATLARVTHEHRARPEVDHYGSQYSNFESAVLAAVRSEAFGDDYGQNGWQSAAEQDLFIAHLALDAGSRVLDVACGSGGPALRIAARSGCSVVGVDLHEDGIATARKMAVDRGLADRADFQRADATQTLPFPDGSFDAVICIDAINHLPDRARVLAEFRRVLKPRGRLLYTDPVVVTGWLSSDEIRIRSSIGFFLYFPPGVNEQLLDAAGFQVDAVHDRTENIATAAQRWLSARAARAEALRAIEGAAAFEGQQTFFEVATRLASERRLSRLAFFARRAETG